MERNRKTLLQWHEQTFDYDNINSRREFLRVTIDSKGNLQLYGGKTLKYCLQFVFVMD